ncbi:glycosyltransferase [Flaviflexus massiliensis]|uniref:glycosyltransferase n=1 Tax=Flaviflexus massiliensis TaxID=1522309 RepID=UPI0006D532A3|nr:glycosyltransferase [Flaviflexus massiliensis]
MTQNAGERLRIAMIALHTSPLATTGSGEAGGLNVYLLSTAKELVNLGHHVFLVSRKDREELPDSEEVGDGLTAVYLTAGPVTSVPKSESEQLIEPFREALDVWLAGESIDVVHSHHWFAGLAGIPAARKHSIPHVYSYHSIAAPEGSGVGGGEAAESQGRIPGEKWIAEQPGRIVSVSEFEKQLIVDRYGADPSQVSIAPPGVNTELFAPPAVTKQEEREDEDVAEPYIMFAARLHPLKGAELVLRALSLMTPDWRPRLVVTGDPASGFDDYRDELRILASHLGVEPKVEWMSSVTREELAKLLGGALFLVNPSHLETYGIINVEAQACGTPVIASHVGGMVESVRDGETGYLIKGRDPVEWTRAMERLIRDDRLRRVLGKNARAFALTRQWSDVGAELDVIYQGEVL